MNTKILVPALALASASAAGFARAPEALTAADEAVPRAPHVVALKFHADWCGSCKAMGPVFEDLANKFDTEPVLFLTFDHTTEPERRQAEYLAVSLGLEELWREHGGKTGFVLLVDPAERTVVEKLSKDDDLKAMGAALQRALADARGSGER